ncbi:MAG: hypothetical protein U9Q07_14755 [Planctomycetota bacterium]|nr:hypothetical protein [Planctomycetota bacterium]
MKQELYYNSTTDELVLDVKEWGWTTTPSSVTLSIYGPIAPSPSGLSFATDYTNPLVEDESITPDADGVCKYAPGTTVTAYLGQNLRAEWTFTIDSDIHTRMQLFDVVYNKLYSIVTSHDLIKECSALEDMQEVYYGTVESGTTLTAVDNQLIGRGEDSFRGGEIEFLTGNNAETVKIVTAFDAETGTITWSGAITAAADGDTFLLRKSYQHSIDRAFEEIKDLIIQAGGYRPALIMNVEDLKTPHIFLALEKVCRDLSGEIDDIWWSRANNYKQQFKAKWAGIKFVYDSYEDEIPDEIKTQVIGFRR